MGRNLIDLNGQQFGRWTVLERVPSAFEPMWKCRCECGTERSIAGQALRGGVSNSCGCGRRGPKAALIPSHDEHPADDALTTDAELRLRQMNLVMYSARLAAEEAGVRYRAAVKRMRYAEINFHRAVNERRQRSISAIESSGAIGVSLAGPSKNRTSRSVDVGAQAPLPLA